MLHVVSEAVILNVPVAFATAVNETVDGATESDCPWRFARAESNRNAIGRSFFIKSLKYHGLTDADNFL
jgi:hypothetical protein